MQGGTPLPEEDGGENTISTFNFDEIWTTVDNNYPILQWQEN